jgi:hypothetical protein
VKPDVKNGYREGNQRHRTNREQQFCSQLEVIEFLKHLSGLLKGLKNKL